MDEHRHSRVDAREQIYSLIKFALLLS